LFITKIKKIFYIIKKNTFKANDKVEKDFQLIYKSNISLSKDIENPGLASDFENKFMTTLQSYAESANSDSSIIPPIRINDNDNNNNESNINNFNNIIYLNKEEEDSKNYIDRDLENIYNNVHANEKESLINDLICGTYAFDDDFIDYLYNTS
jgi:hypothetical protein